MCPQGFDAWAHTHGCCAGCCTMSLYATAFYHAMAPTRRLQPREVHTRTAIHAALHESLHTSLRARTHKSLHTPIRMATKVLVHLVAHMLTHACTHGNAHASTLGNAHASTHGNVHVSTHGNAHTCTLDLTEAVPLYGHTEKVVNMYRA